MAFSRDDILAKMGLDVRDFNDGLKDAEKKSESFSKKIGKAWGSISFSKIAVGATAAAAAVGYVGKQLVDAADDLKDASDALNLNVESLQKFEAGFATAGVESEKFRKAFAEMTSEIDKAIGGDPKALQAFKDVGVTLNMLKGLSPEEIFFRVSDGIKEADTYGKALNQTMAIFGAKAKGLTPLLQEGSEEIKKGFGNVTIASEEAINNLGQIADAWELAKKSAMAYGIEATNSLSGVAKKIVGSDTFKNMIVRKPGFSNSAPSASSTDVEKTISKAVEEGTVKGISKAAPASARGAYSPTLANMEAEERNKAQWRKDAPAAGRGGAGMTDAALNHGMTTERQRELAEHEAKARQEMDEKSASMDEVSRKKNEESFQKSADKLVDAGSKIQKKIEDAADALAAKASDFQKTGQERREERQTVRDQERAERTVKKREMDTANRKAAGSYGSQEEREVIESEKRKGFFGEEGKKELGKGPVSAQQKAEEKLTGIDDKLGELLKLYGKTAK